MFDVYVESACLFSISLKLQSERLQYSFSSPMPNRSLIRFQLHVYIFMTRHDCSTHCVPAPEWHSPVSHFMASSRFPISFLYPGISSLEIHMPLMCLHVLMYTVYKPRARLLVSGCADAAFREIRSNCRMKGDTWRRVERPDSLQPPLQQSLHELTLISVFDI